MVCLEYCPECDTEMDFIGKYGQWYCPDCNKYHVPLHESTLPPIDQRMKEERYRPNAYMQRRSRYDHRRETQSELSSGRKPVISYNMLAAAVVMVVILMIASLISLVYFESGKPGSTDDVYVRTEDGSTYFDPDFPTVALTIVDGYEGKDCLSIKHVKGDPLYWSDHKIIITNCNDKHDTMTCADMGPYGTITAGELTRIYLDDTGHGLVDLTEGCEYEIEIYNVKDNERVFVKDNVYCQ